MKKGNWGYFAFLVLILSVATTIAMDASATQQDHRCQGGHNCNSGGGGGSESNSSALSQQQQAQQQGQDQGQTQSQSLITVNGAPGGAAGATATGSGAGDGVSVLSPNASGGSSNSSSGGNTYKTDNTNFSLWTSAANIDGCMTGKGAGGGGGGGGGFINWASLNIPCFLNTLGDSERHVDVRARLKCGSKPFRNAVTYDVKGNTMERTKACIEFVVPIWKAEIDYLKELATDKLPDAGATKEAMLLADAGNAELETKIAVLEAELAAERRMQAVQIDQQQQIQQQQIQNEAEIGVKVTRAEQRREEAQLYLERIEKRDPK